MNTQLDPIVSEFETQEQADSYDRWLTAKVQRSIDNPGQGMPHDQVMTKVDAIIADAEQRQRGGVSGACLSTGMTRRLTTCLSLSYTSPSAILKPPGGCVFVLKQLSPQWLNTPTYTKWAACRVREKLLLTQTLSWSTK